MPQKILIIDDEPSIADNIVYALRTEGFDPHWRSTGEHALQELRVQDYALMILDVGLPDINGFELARTIKQESTIPIIFVTARSDEIDRVVGLELGADDYVVKPFSPRELSARVKAVLRRAGAGNPASQVEPVELASPVFLIDEPQFRILYRGVQLELSRTEYRLLKVLVAFPGRVYSREQLMDHAWEHTGFSLERTVDTHIKTIRRKLKAVYRDEDPIVTHRGIGYSLRLGK
ncbi:MAG: two-component system response regulator CreB, partial [Gammaproteobacteria bacterium]